MANILIEGGDYSLKVSGLIEDHILVTSFNYESDALGVHAETVVPISDLRILVSWMKEQIAIYENGKIDTSEEPE